MVCSNEIMNRYKKIIFTLSIFCGLLLFSNLFLLLSNNEPKTIFVSSTVDYDNINNIALNFKKYAIGPEGIDRFSQNIMLLTRLTTEIEKSKDYSSEFMLYYTSMQLLCAMQTKEGEMFVKENSDTIGTFYSDIYNARRANEYEQYSLEINNLYDYLTQGYPEGHYTLVK